MSETTSPALPKATRHRGKSRPKVPPFARYEGTSAWRKNRVRVRAYARYLAETSHSKQDPATPAV